MIQECKKDYDLEIVKFLDQRRVDKIQKEKMGTRLSKEEKMKQYKDEKMDDLINPPNIYEDYLNLEELEDEYYEEQFKQKMKFLGLYQVNNTNKRLLITEN